MIWSWLKKPTPKKTEPVSPETPVLRSTFQVWPSPWLVTPYWAWAPVPEKPFLVMTFTTPAMASEP